MPDAEDLAARLHVYRLVESSQGDDHATVPAALDEVAAEAKRQGWTSLGLLVSCARLLHDLLHAEDRDAVRFTATDLVHRSEALGATELTAVALALRSVLSAEQGDGRGVVVDAGRAVALADSEDLPPLERCFAWVVAAAAYNTLNLWELGADLYERTLALGPACPEPAQEAAVTINRVLVRLEWAAALFELGEELAALDQLRIASRAAVTAELADRMPRLWRLDVLACRDLLAFVLAAFEDRDVDVEGSLVRLAEHRATIEAGGDVEVVPMLDALVALSLLRLGRVEQAQESVASTQRSRSTGAHSFLAWVRAQVAAGGRTDEALRAAQDYGAIVARLRWNARTAVLEAARSKIEDERLSVEHAVLARDVLLDPLTGLANRRCFDDWLERRTEHDTATALLLLDVDHFKRVNDIHGHAVGDATLRRVAELVASHVRADDMALRLGGDEFAVVLTGDDEDALGHLAHRRAEAIRSAVAGTAWDALSRGLEVHVSVGVAVDTVRADRPGGPDRLYRAADAELYDAKAAGDPRALGDRLF